MDDLYLAGAFFTHVSTDFWPVGPHIYLVFEIPFILRYNWYCQYQFKEHECDLHLSLITACVS